MLYEDYLVTDCGMREGNNQKVYFCELVGHNDHKISFSLVIRGCVGEKEYNAQYEAVAPHIHVGDLLHCEFAYRWHSYNLNLCLSGFIQTKVHRVGSYSLGDTVPPEEYFKSNRGYWVTTEVYGQWVRFPGLISFGGDSCIHTNFEGNYPQLSFYQMDSAKGHLVWKPKTVEQEGTNRSRIGKIIGKFIPAFVQV